MLHPITTKSITLKPCGGTVVSVHDHLGQFVGLFRESSPGNFRAKVSTSKGVEWVDFSDRATCVVAILGV